MHLVAQPARALAARARLPGRVPRPPTTCRDVLEHRPIGLEGLDDRLDRGHEARVGLHRRGPGAAARRAAAGCWSSSAATRRTRPTSSARELHGALEHGDGAPSAMKLYDDPPRRSTSGRCARRGSARPRSSRASRDTWEGWEDSAVPPERLGDYLRDLDKLVEPYGYEARSTATSARAACTRASNFDFAHRRGHRDVPALPRRGGRPGASRYGGSLSGEHGDGQSRGGAAAEDVRRRAGRGVPRVQGDLGPRWKMNPGKVVDPYPIDANLRLGTDYDPPRVDDALRVSRRRRQLRARDRRAASASASAGAPTAATDVPELHGHARGEALHPRPRAPPLRDAERRRASPAAGTTRRSRRRWTSAWPARAARPTAR